MIYDRMKNPEVHSLDMKCAVKTRLASSRQCVGVYGNTALFGMKLKVVRRSELLAPERICNYSDDNGYERQDVKPAPGRHKATREV